MAATASLKALRLGFCFALASLLAACGGGGGGGSGGTGGGGGGGGGGGAITYTIGGSITGLSGTLVLQNNGANNLSRSANGSFTFTTAVSSGGSYSVTILTQPNNQTCTVANASGTATANVTNVAITCVDGVFTLGGTVSGLSGTLVLAESGVDTVAISASGNFQFPAKLDSASAYSVSVYKQPLGQTCTITSGAIGTATTNVSNVVVSCANNPYTVGGTVAGLSSTGTAVLQLNLADNITVGNGNFSFPKPLAAGAAYQVSIVLGSTLYSCNVANGAGTANANVTNVAITCTVPPATFSLGGKVTGLSGSVTLRNGANAETITLSGNASFTFTTPVAAGTAYVVTVQTQPSGQTCTVLNAVGTINGASPAVLQVTCAAGTETHTVGGTVTGLKAALSLGIDTNNDFLTVNAPVSGAATYTFPVPLQVDTEFQVYIHTQPTGQTCVIPHSSSHVGNANLTDIVVTCVDNVTDPLVGSYTSVDNTFVVSLYASGVYVFATIEDDATCGTSHGIGIEMGAYHYDATAGTLAFLNAVLDTNGSSCGVWRNGASIVNGALVKTGVGQGAVLKLTPTTGTTVALVPVNAAPSLPTGTFFVPISSSFLWIRDDGRYIEVNAKDDPASSAPAGLEYGCYSRAGTQNGTLTPTVSTATCAGAIDTDNTAGLSGTAGVAVPYTVNPSFIIFNSAKVFLRLLAN